MMSNQSNLYNQQPLNVHQFGAVGDGMSDDTKAIQNAIDAAAEMNELVYFPAGIFACSKLTLRSHVTLSGCASWTYWYYKGSIIKLMDDKVSCLMDATEAKGAVIDGLVFDGLGPDGKQLGNNIHGIMIHTEPFLKFDKNGAFDNSIRVERSLMRNFSGDGIHFDGVCSFTVRHSMIANNLGNGIYLHGFDGYILDCWLSANKKAGFGAYKLNASMTITANRIEWNQEGGIVIRGGNHYNITGNFFDRCGGPAIWLRKNGSQLCSQFALTGNVIRRSGSNYATLGKYASSHVNFEGCRGLTFTGNTMSIEEEYGEKGDYTPAYGIVYSDLDNCIISNNVLQDGGTKELVMNLDHDEKENVLVKDNVGCIFTPK